MNEKIAIVTELVKEGYHLFDESIEDFAARFNKEDLEMFLECFRNRV